MSSRSLGWNASMAMVAVAVAVTLCTAGGSWAQNQPAITVAWDASGQVCNLETQPGQEGWMYVLAYSHGFVTEGITGAEFRVDGFPSDWFILAIETNPLAAISIGSPLGAGCNIAFPLCMEAPGPTLLYTVHFLVSSTAVVNHVVSVTRHTTPSNPSFMCPVAIACDVPCGCAACVDGGAAAINDPGFCTTAVQPASWSRVRSLYR